MATPAEALLQFLAALDKLQVGYLVSGSVASSIHGISRPTMDIDIVADLHRKKVESLANALGPEFYADTDTMREAIDRGRAFNLIHIPTTYKIDVFPLGADEYSQMAFSRRRLEQSRSLGPEPISCAVATAEDIILRKLEWYRAGGEVSDRQWNDLRGVIKVSGVRLDLAYLRRWAATLHVHDLLERLLAEGA